MTFRLQTIVWKDFLFFSVDSSGMYDLESDGTTYDLCLGLLVFFCNITFVLRKIQNKQFSMKEMNPNPDIYGQWIFDKSAETFEWLKNSLFNKWF